MSFSAYPVIFLLSPKREHIPSKAAAGATLPARVNISVGKAPKIIPEISGNKGRTDKGRSICSFFIKRNTDKAKTRKITGIYFLLKCGSCISVFIKQNIIAAALRRQFVTAESFFSFSFLHSAKKEAAAINGEKARPKAGKNAVPITVPAAPVKGCFERNIIMSVIKRIINIREGEWSASLLNKLASESILIIPRAGKSISGRINMPSSSVSFAFRTRGIKSAVIKEYSPKRIKG